jgi:hypothetical protein
MKKNLMKNLTVSVLSAAMALSLTACGGSSEPAASQSAADVSASKTYKVGICNYVDDASLNQIVDNIQSRLKELGAAKTSAYYSVAPFLGVVFGVLILGERPGLQFFLGLLLMVMATVLLVRDTIGLQHTHTHSHDHAHLHRHGALEHSHPHSHTHTHSHIHGDDETVHDHGYDGEDDHDHIHTQEE